jgi:hypothetical protein
MTARTTVTLQCDRARDERCHGIFQANVSGLRIDAARRMAHARGWRTFTPIDAGREQDVCPACWDAVADAYVWDEDAWRKENAG